MTPPRNNRFFFVHVMKTGGTSFADLTRINFDTAQRYPDVVLPEEADDLRRMEAYTYVPRLVADAREHGDNLRMVRGHVPYAVRSLLPGQFVAMTILRNPVDRTLSYLKHCRKYHQEHAGLDIEAIYEQPWFFESFIHNYQTKIFSMSAEESMAESRFGDRTPPLPPRADFVEGQELPSAARTLVSESPARFTLELFSPSTGVVEADARRLSVARENLLEVELVGVTEGYENFLRELERRYDWDIRFIPHKNAGEDLSISQEFRTQIESDNALDMELYELARSMAP